MCGVAGFFNVRPFKLDENSIISMLEPLRSRGPDALSWIGVLPNQNLYWKQWEDAVIKREKSPLQAAIGSSRLAIVDRSEGGMHPLSNEDKSIWSVLNGEIFNYQDLREELKERGHVFHSLTDTEVVTHAYEEWQEKCFEHLNGHFGIGIYDKKKGILLIGRDRLGVKPLFWHKNNSFFLFASEIKSLLQAPSIKKRVNHRKLATCMALPYKLHENHNETLFEDIYQVQPGSFMIIDSKLKLQKGKFWNISSIACRKEGSFEERKEELDALLVDAVKIRSLGDLGITALLSGGIDSSSITGIIRSRFNLPIETFSLNLPDERYNELEEIRELASFFKIKTNIIDVSPDMIKPLLSELIGIIDENVPTPNGILHLILAKAIAAKKYKVVLNGVGGDEMFLGYHDHFLFFLKHLQDTNNPAFEKELDLWVNNQKRSLALFSNFSNYLANKEYKTNPDYLSRNRCHDYEPLLKKDYNNIHFESPDFFGEKNYDIFNKQLFDITAFTLPHALKMDDRYYMSQGIETRHPFLDYRIVEFGLSLPPLMKIKNATTKYLLRAVAQKYIPSSRLNDSRKIGLNLPVDKWMQNELKCWLDDNLENKNNPIFEFADYNQVNKIVQSHIKGQGNLYLKLWDLININTWLKKFF